MPSDKTVRFDDVERGGQRFNVSMDHWTNRRVKGFYLCVVPYAEGKTMIISDLKTVLVLECGRFSAKKQEEAKALAPAKADELISQFLTKSPT